MDKAKEQRVHLLEVQKRRLAEKVDVQKAELAEKRERIEALERRWSEAQATVLAVRRGWRQLQEDLNEVAERAGVRGESPSPDCVFFDPFLSALLTPAERTNAEGLAVEREAEATAAAASDVEIEIKREAEGVAARLASLLSTGGAASVRHDVEGRAEVRALRERLRATEDRLTRREAEVAETRRELTDVQTDLEAARRKILSYKNSTGAAAPSQPPTHPPDAKAEERTGDRALQDLCIDSLIQSKIVELENERKEHLKTQKALRLLQLSRGDEAWVRETRVYQELSAQKREATERLEEKRRELDRMRLSLQAKDREIAKKRSCDPEMRVELFGSLKETQKRLKELQGLVMEYGKRERGAVTVTLEDSTAAEYGELLSKAQNEANRVKKHLKECVSDLDLVGKARNESIEASRRMRTAESRVEQLNDSAKEFDSYKKHMRMREEQLRDNKDDLQLFVDVLMSYDTIRDQRKDAEIVARERNTERKNAALKRKIEEMERNGGSDETLKEVESSRKKIKKLREKLELKHVEVEDLARRKKHHEDDLAQQKQLNVFLQEELEQTGTAYDEAQTQNERLLKQLTERDVDLANLRHQIAELTGRVEMFKSLVENLDSKAQRDATEGAELQKIRNEFEGRLAELKEENGDLKREVETAEACVCEKGREVGKYERELQEARREVEGRDRTILDQKKRIEAEVEQCLRERQKLQKMEADVKAFEDLKRKVQSGTLVRGDVTAEEEMTMLNKEVENFRRMLSCSICGTRKKSVVLLKCMHTFCKPCVDNRIDTRSRRCPGCGSPFSREDVKEFYLT